MQIFRSANILIPRLASMEKWSVIACDQFTSEPEYWRRVRNYVADEPSTLDLILPEAEMTGDPSRIKAINENMELFLSSGIFTEYKDSYVYVERTLLNGRIRKGVVGAVDLENYNFLDFAASAVRATERTVTERIPARVDIRKGAPLELPHTIVLCDDAKHILLESLEAKKNTLPLLYSFDLMEGGGHVTGRLVAGKDAAAFDALLDEYALENAERYKNTGMTPLLFAVGDGNHSLAAAKSCYESLKSENKGRDMSDHPSRYSLVELENLHDEALEFEPIHRLATGVNPDELLDFLEADIGQKDGYEIDCVVSGGGKRKLTVHCDKNSLAVATLQEGLDRYFSRHAGKLDYIHERETLERLASSSKDCCGFILPALDKNNLFGHIVMEGVLPRKTFSMGHAVEKRYYLEARRITS